VRDPLGHGEEVGNGGNPGDVTIVPEPSPAERAAILLALRALDGRRPTAGEWWSAGLREAIGDDGRSASH
jgi:hypothetical protein